MNRPALRLRTSPCNLAALLSWAGLTLSGCWSFSRLPSPTDGTNDQPRLDAAQSIAAIDEQVKLTVRHPPSGCSARWSVASAGANLLHPGASEALFQATRPGRYVISYSCGDRELTSTIDSFVPTLSLTANSPLTLPVACRDAAFTASGHLLCVNQGVSVVDVSSGKLVGRTVENEPVVWGIDAQADLFATASGGCASCGPSGQPVPAGALLYRLPPSGQPELLARLSSTPAEEVAFADSRLYVTTTSQVVAFDISRPTAPQQVGCLAADLEESLPRLAGGVLFTASYDKLRSFSLSSLSPSCETLTAPLAELPLSQILALLPPSLVSRAGLFYLGLPTKLQAVDVHEPTVLQPGFAANLPLLGLGLADDRLLVAADGKLYAFDLRRPDKPRPVGFLRLPMASRAYFGVVDGKLRMVSGSGLWTLSLAPPTDED